MTDQNTTQLVDISDQEWGSDYIADLLKAYEFEFVSFNPGASFRGLEESIVNYNDNVPTVIETMHEGLSVSIAHGYAKATGKPACCVLHNVVGTLHGTMGLYNAYCDRVPVVTLSGTGPMRKSMRRPWIEWIHTALIQGNLVRGFVKWDDQPVDIDGTAESITRGVRIANTPPKGPVYITLDHDVQECRLDDPMELPDLEKLGPPSKIYPDPAVVSDTVDRLMDAEFPIIIVDQVGDSKSAVEQLIILSERIGAPVIDPRRRRYNFPTTHPHYLQDSDMFRTADVVVAIDVWSPNSMLKDTDRVRHLLSESIEGEFEFINIGMHELEISSLIPNSFSSREADIAMLADSELALPAINEEVARRLEEATSDVMDTIQHRKTRLADVHGEQRNRWRTEVEEAWDDSPISLPRLTSDLWEVVNEDQWVLVNGDLRGWIHKLWDVDEFDSYVGSGSGGAGVGYGIGGAIGGALAYADSDRIPINIQADGGLMSYPSGLWTISHYNLPMLTVVHNNMALYNSTEHRMRLAEYRERDASYERALIGTGIVDPTPDYAALAESVDMKGYGPIEEPTDLMATLQAAWNDVKNGMPVLVDVVSQHR